MPTMTKQPSSLGGYLVLRTVTARDVNGNPSVHRVGTVLSEWELEEYVKTKIGEGSMRYRAKFEPLTVDEVKNHREKDTALEGDRNVSGNMVSPPWPDFVGLHPEEVVARLRDSKDRNLVERVKQYESAGLNRDSVMDYVAPVEREPWGGYDNLDVRDILAKLEVLSESQISEVVTYEYAHRNRPAIVSYSKEDQLPAPTAPTADLTPSPAIVTTEDHTDSNDGDDQSNADDEDGETS